VHPGPTLRFDRVTLRRNHTTVLDGISWEVKRGERWIALGPNGSGKTTLLQLASGAAHPTTGTVDVLGSRLGRVDVRQLRTRIGLVSGAVTRLLRPGLAARDVVMTGRNAALETWWHAYSDADRSKAEELLRAAGLAGAAGRPFGVLSEGERQQVLLARALMGEPELLLFDEPAAGLDLGARERLLTRLDQIARDPATPPIVFVTHHVEEIPPSFESVLLLRAGAVVAAGPIDAVLNDTHLSRTFDTPVRVVRVDGRFAARADPRVG
jgi:iron complex transport system ATP-binding protein